MDRVFEVKDLTGYISRLLSEDILLSDLKVSGEISNFTHHSSGHMYFSLKDDKSKIKCIMFKGYNQKLDFKPENGMEVIVSGNISVYEREGQYQLYVKSMEVSGMGDLYIEYEKLKSKLEEEGFFDQAYKKDIPAYPRKIGIVTSATGAAIRDILNVLNRRYPIAKIYIYPSLVQGKEASDEIIKGLITLDNYNLDTIILARGGGSLEDLFCFNDEDLAKVIFALKTPIISGIGHEIDFTIADFVADLRAPTPSSAAELASPDIRELKDNVNEIFQDIYSNILDNLYDEEKNLLSYKKDINHYSPQKMIYDSYQTLDYKWHKIIKNNRLDLEKARLDLLSQRIDSVNPLTILNRGYSILLKENDIIYSKKDINEEDIYNLKLKDGEVNFKFNILD